ncbi:MAG: DUF3883 domain-containing protein [Alphaproteobacteria bacterium]|nr:DUF3883 domain-containing protein [Alphaproteobacteria bacterium]
MQSADVTDNEKQRIKEYPIIKCQDGLFRKPANVYQDTPDLRAWFGKQERNYAITNIDSNDLYVLGVASIPHWKSYRLENEQIPQNIREETRTKSQTDVFHDIELDGINDIHVSMENAVQVARIIDKAHKDFGTRHLGTFETQITLFNSVYLWIRNKVFDRNAPTRILNKLHSINWVLTKDGTLANPMHVSMDQIHPDVFFLTNLPDCVFGADLKQQLCDQLAQMGACPVLCENQEEVEVAKRALEEYRNKKNLQQTGNVVSDTEEESEDAQEEWQPEVPVEDANIEEGILRYTSPDRGEIGSVSNTKSTAATCKSDESPQTKKNAKLSEKDKQRIGADGEIAVKRHLMEKEGFSESEINILNTDWENSTGRDIEVIQNGDVVKYIEVKATQEVPPCRHMFETSGKQWEVARKHQDKYWLYCVFGIGTANITVYPIQNPNKLWKEGKLEAHPVNFVVKA